MIGCFNKKQYENYNEVSDYSVGDSEIFMPVAVMVTLNGKLL